MDPLSYAHAVKRRWKLVALCVLVGLGIGYATTLVSTASSSARQYQATTVLLNTGVVFHNRWFCVWAPATCQRESSAGIGPGAQILGGIVTKGAVPARVATDIGYSGDPLDLASHITVEGKKGLMNITATTHSPDRAVLLSTTFTQELINFLNEQRANVVAIQSASIKKQIDRLTKQIADLNHRIRKLTGLHRAGRGVLLTSREVLITNLADLEARYQNLVAKKVPPLEIQREPIAHKVSGNSLREALRATGTRLLIGGLLGLLAGLLLVLVLERLDPRIRSKEQVEESLGLPVLAEIPLVRRSREGRVHASNSYHLLARVLSRPLVPVPGGSGERAMAGAAGQTASPATDVVIDLSKISSLDEGDRQAVTDLVQQVRTQRAEYEGDLLTLRTADVEALARNSAREPEILLADLRPALRDQPTLVRRPHVILVVSPSDGEGRSTIVANLAAAFGDTGNDVLAVSCDFRRPTLHRLFDVPDEHGLGELLRTDGPMSLDGYAYETYSAGVRVIPTGDTSTRVTELMGNGSIGEFVRAARQDADVVVIDTPPMLVSSEPSFLFPEVDTVLVVARVAKTLPAEADRAREMLDRLGAPVVGVALNAVGEIAESPRSDVRANGNGNGYGFNGNGYAP
jgi:capsular exopolysaccharide synthesis family protein